MTIIFLNPSDYKIYICTENHPMKILNIDDPNLMDHIPNDDILYVKDGHMLNRGQFADFLSGNKTMITTPSEHDDFDSGFRFNTTSNKYEQPVEDHNERMRNAHKLYIHPKHNGSIRIEDIQTRKFPDGVELTGKWDFIAIDEIGQDVLDESSHFGILMAKGKIEVVNHDFYLRNKHKKQNASPTDAALDSIIIQDQRRGAARAAATGGGLDYVQGYNDVAPTIYVE